jgi:signal-transduction protein with cAMP-binding, CBS, and nucleotidyltransferase domain
MQSPVCVVAEAAPALEALHRMTRSACGRLAVVDSGGNMVGVVTRNDLMRAIEVRTIGLRWDAGRADGFPPGGPRLAAPGGNGAAGERPATVV